MGVLGLGYSLIAYLISICLFIVTEVHADDLRGRITDSSSRIVGGSDVPNESYPWFVKFSGCGGSLISPEYVLTAAHCETALAGKAKVGALCTGFSSFSNCGQTQEEFTVEDYWIHPDYNDDTLHYDYAVVKLSGKSTITPVAIDDGTYTDSYSSGSKLWAAGFGVLYYGGQYSPSTLQHVLLDFVEHDVCDNLYADYGGITEQMICAGGEGKDGCQGDSGGPLYDKDNNVLVGITSWGIGCGMDHPGIWAKVSAEHKWITEKVCEGHSYPKPSFCEGMTDAPTVSPKPTASPTASGMPTISPTRMNCDSGEMFVSLNFQTDGYGYENSWTLMEYATKAIIKSDSYLDNDKLHEYKFCIPCSDYQFNVTDSYGDGLLDKGWYTLKVEDNVVDEYTYNDDPFKTRATMLSEGNDCPMKTSCGTDEITFDIKHYGLHHGSELRWAIEEHSSGDLIHDKTNLKAATLNIVRLCLECGRYIFRVWNEYEFAAGGGLAISVDGNIHEQYNLLYDVGVLNSTAFSGENCPSYIRFKSANNHLGVDFCMQPKYNVKNSQIVVKPCSDDTKQLWKPDEIGQFHTYSDSTLCITKVKNMFRLKPCMKKYSSTRAKSIAYSYFTKQLIWMNDAKRSLTINANPRQENTVFMKLYVENSATQQWFIEEV